MEYTQRLSQEQWTRIYTYLCTFPRLHTRHEEQCRRFVEAVLWILRSGSQWRFLPSSYGNWNVVYQRFVDWKKCGIWENMFSYFADNPDMDAIMIDSTILRVFGRTPVLRVL